MNNIESFGCRNIAMDLAPIGTCKKCEGGFFVNGNFIRNYCSKECADADADIVLLEERISELENKQALFEKRLERCSKKLGLDFSSIIDS